MIRHILTINDQPHLLLDDDHVDRVKQALLDAVHNNGGFVEIPTGPESTLEALVTPATPVNLEHIWVDDDAETDADRGDDLSTSGMDFI